MDRRPLWAGIALFVLCVLVYRLAPVGMPGDSHYSMLLSEQIWRHGNFQLDAYFEHPERHWPGDQSPYGTNLPHQVYRHDGHIFYSYPPGTPLLSIPFVMLENTAGISATNKRRGYSMGCENRIERDLSALLSAATVVALFALALRYVPFRPALFIALAAAFGSSLLSSASRSLWSHTWGVLLLSLALLQVTRPGAAWTLPRIVLFGTNLAFLYFTRPSFNISIVALFILALLRDRRILVPLAITGLCWLALFLAYGWHVSGRLLTPYYGEHDILSLRDVPSHLAGLLLSPSRGLLIFSPVIIPALFLLARNFRRLGDRTPAACALFASGALIFLLSMFPFWWGGACYGPRLLTDCIPWLALLGALAWAAERSRNQSRKLLVAASTTLLVISFAMHAIGAFSSRSVTWLLHRLPDDAASASAMWDWNHPQFAVWQAPQ